MMRGLNISVFLSPHVHGDETCRQALPHAIPVVEPGQNLRKLKIICQLPLDFMTVANSLKWHKNFWLV
jgi:hypothetical protein